MARRHAVVSGHYYASLAGLQVLEAGGNAIDAGVATGLAIDVLESEFVGFGGVAPVMVHLGERAETHVISGVGVWPKAANVEHFHRNFGGRIPEGLLHTVVPAAPSIWVTALARFGTMSFGEVAAAAIRFARDGFPTYPFLAEQLAARQSDFSQWPISAIPTSSKCRCMCCCRTTTRRNGARGSIRRRHGPVCRRRARSVGFRSRPGGPILPPGASGDCCDEARDLVPVRCRQPWQRVCRDAKRSDDFRAGGAGYRHHRLHVGFAWLHRT